MLAEWTGLEPATPGVTGRYSNQLNYHSVLVLLNHSSVVCAPQPASGEDVALCKLGIIANLAGWARG